MGRPLSFWFFSKLVGDIIVKTTIQWFHRLPFFYAPCAFRETATDEIFFSKRVTNTNIKKISAKNRFFVLKMMAS